MSEQVSIISQKDKIQRTQIRLLAGFILVEMKIIAKHWIQKYIWEDKTRTTMYILGVP